MDYTGLVWRFRRSPQWEVTLLEFLPSTRLKLVFSRCTWGTNFWGPWGRPWRRRLMGDSKRLPLFDRALFPIASHPQPKAWKLWATGQMGRLQPTRMARMENCAPSKCLWVTSSTPPFSRTWTETSDLQRSLQLTPPRII